MSAVYLPYIYIGGVNSGRLYIGEVISGHGKNIFTLIYPIFDVESIGEVPRGPRAHLDIKTLYLTLACTIPLRL